MSTKAQDKAYQAGRALISVQWPQDTPVDTSPGLHHCPFDPELQADEWRSWVKGLRDALQRRDEEERKRKSVLAEIEKAIGGKD